MNTNCIQTSKASVIILLLTEVAVTSLFITGKPAHAQFISNNSQPRAYVAITHILSDGTINNFTSEIIFPQDSISTNGNLTIKIIYGSVDNNFNQVAIMKEHTNDETVNYTDKTIHAAIVNNIDTAINDHSLDDIGDIVKSLQSGGSSALD